MKIGSRGRARAVEVVSATAFTLLACGTSAPPSKHPAGDANAPVQGERQLGKCTLTAALSGDSIVVTAAREATCWKGTEWVSCEPEPITVTWAGIKLNTECPACANGRHETEDAKLRSHLDEQGRATIDLSPLQPDTALAQDPTSHVFLVGHAKNGPPCSEVSVDLSKAPSYERWKAQASNSPAQKEKEWFRTVTTECNAGKAESCFEAGSWLAQHDESSLAINYLDPGCRLGDQRACSAAQRVRDRASGEGVAGQGRCYGGCIRGMCKAFEMTGHSCREAAMKKAAEAKCAQCKGQDDYCGTCMSSAGATSPEGPSARSDAPSGFPPPPSTAPPPAAGTRRGDPVRHCVQNPDNNCSTKKFYCDVTKENLEHPGTDTSDGHGNRICCWSHYHP